MITFPVSDVHPTGAPLHPVSLAVSLQARTKHSVEATGCNLPGLTRSSRHGLLAAIQLAFDAHLPLVLSPDDIWLCIAQGFAAHVNAHAEELRERFVQHQGKVQLTVCRNDFVRGSPANDWPGVFAELSDQISAHVGRKRDLVVADFSTTGPIERAASEIVLFDALQAYFEYNVRSTCGIPQITLLGTSDDWLSIRRRVEVFTEFNLADWTRALLPVLDQFVAASRGAVDRAFWQSLHKYQSMSGDIFVTGWVNTLFPYLRAHDDGTGKLLPRWNSHVTDWQRGMGFPVYGGPERDDFPLGLSTAPFTWEYHGKTIAMAFLGGFVGVSQDQATGAVRPAIGWAVGEA